MLAFEAFRDRDREAAADERADAGQEGEVPADRGAEIQAHGAFTNISIYVMRSDGSDVQRVLTGGDGEALLPGSWRN